MNLATYQQQLTQMEEIRKVIGRNAGKIDIPQELLDNAKDAEKEDQPSESD